MVTIRDVGRLARVSIGTVSNVLNAPHRVRAETRRRVLAAVDQLGYRPNRAARSLAARRTHLIGYQLPDSPTTTDPSLDAFLHHLVAAASEHGLELVLFSPRDGQDEPAAYRELIWRGAVDGFILSGTNYADPRIEFLLAEGFPFVAFGRAAGADRFSWVDVDGAAGTRAAVAHLVGQGHRRIGAVAWPEGSESGDARLDGYRAAMEAVGLRPHPVVRAENLVAEGRAAYRGLVGADPSLTAVVCVQDTLALGLMMEAVADGRRVGIDLAVAGFDDTPIASLAAPPLTSVRQPFEEVGGALAEMLATRLDDGAGRPRGLLLTPVLVPRESTGGPGP
jgi:DNA-binding LacI/PurR family transcriptional regulator